MMSLTRLRFLRSKVLIIAALSLGFGVSTTARADDWSLQRKSNDPTLVGQRMGKLRRSPFDRAQWNALRQAIGMEGLARKIRGELSRNPKSVALRVLDARVDLAQGKAGSAAKKLGALEADAGRHVAAVFELRIKALGAADDWGTAVGLLERRAEAASGGKKAKLLERAYAAADRGNRAADGLRLAQKLASVAPGTASSLRLARAARDAKDHKLADRAYADAVAASGGARKDELTAERARARLDADNAAGASALLWSLLESPKHGARSAREMWWESLGQAHRADRSTDLLIERLSKWLGKNGSEAAAWRTLAAAQESAGVDAVASWRKALELRPKDEEAGVALVEALEARGDRVEAVAAYRSMLGKGTQDIQLGLDLASRVAAAGNHELAEALVADIEAKAGRRATTLTLLLDYYNLGGQPDAALEIARRLVKSNGRKAESRIALGEQLYQMGRVPEAMAQWKMLPKLMRPAHKGHARLAQLLSEHGRTAEAVLSLKQALKLAPKEPNYLRLRAVLAEEQRRPKQALALWEEVRAAASGPAQKILRDEARTRVVELLVGGPIPQRRRQLERATLDAQTALRKRDPLEDALEAGRFLAELQTRQENYSAAVATQEALLAIAPSDPDRLAELAAAQRRAGQVESAMGTLEDLLVAEPARTPDVLAEMSELAFEAGDEERALKTATKAAKRDHNQVEALVRLGELHEARGDTNEAARAYQRALDTTPADARARLRLAELELTRGNDDKSAELLHRVLEDPGPPELVRQAGRRALDLAEASGSLPELLALSIGRTQRRPEADEPRQFLLETLDRVEPSDVRDWMGDGTARDERTRALRAPLVAALTRGSIGTRLRAAEHLGELGLPDTAVPLAKLGATLAAPSDATETVKAAFERTRITALRAAGALEDDAATDIFASLMASPRSTVRTRQVAAWGLARAGSPRATKTLARYLRAQGDAQISTLACLAIAAAAPETIDGDLRLRVRQVANETSFATVEHACAYADAAQTSDANLGRMRDELAKRSGTRAAIAAWRLGTASEPSPASVEALAERIIGPGGLPKDAAAAALSRLLGKDSKRAQRASADDAPPSPTAAWGTTVNRWLIERIAPRHEPLPVSAFEGYEASLAAALESARNGTRAQRAAAHKATEGCSERTGKAVCLRPLVDGAVPVAN